MKKRILGLFFIMPFAAFFIIACVVNPVFREVMLKLFSIAFLSITFAVGVNWLIHGDK